MMRLPHSRTSAFGGPLFAALLLFAGLCSCALAQQLQAADPPSLRSADVTHPSAQILFCNAPGTSCTPATRFSISKLRDLNIVVKWSNLSSGNHAEHLAVSHAAGGLYQSFHKAFLVPEGASTFSTSDSLPVAGTWISQRHLTGTWTVQVSLDGRLVATQTVTLTP